MTEFERDLALEGSIDGMPEGWIPPGIHETPPEILPGALALWDAWQALEWSRETAMGIGPIRVSEVLAYCVLVGVSNLDQRERILWAVQMLDREFLRHHAEERERRGDG